MNWKLARRYSSILAFTLMLVFAVSAWMVGGSLVAPANRQVGPPPADLPFESFELQSKSGATLAAWSIRHESSVATVLLLHHIRGDRRAMLGRARLLYDNGFSVLLIDLQAHGESRGEHITLGHLEKHDVVAAVEYLNQAHPGERIGIIGRSLGGASALLASPLGVDAMVLESVYPTVTDAVFDRVAMRLGVAKYALAPALLCQLPPRLGITTSDLRPIDFVARVECPILITSGEHDKHTPIDETEMLYQTAVEPKRLVVFNDAEHEDLFKFNAEKYATEIVGFLQLYLIDNTNMEPDKARQSTQSPAQRPGT